MTAREKLNVDFLEEDDDEEEDTQTGKYLTFVLGNEEYGIPICHVTEIIGIQKITAVPDMADYVKGVINLRGKVIPVMDVRMRFAAAAREYDERTCVIVIQVGEQIMGLIVDRVSEVLNIPETDIQVTPELKKGKKNRFVRSMGKVGEKVKLLLDVEKLLYDIAE